MPTEFREVMPTASSSTSEAPTASAPSRSGRSGRQLPSPANDRNGYLDQTGDFKLEANVEYRFGIMGRLNGAVFLDAGNIWLLKKTPNAPGAELKWKGLLNEIALGTGFGLRYIISQRQD